MARTRTVYVLRIREDDSAPWGEPTYYRTRRRRDRAAMTCRALGGLRTHSFEEKMTAEDAAAIFNEAND